MMLSRFIADSGVTPGWLGVAALGIAVISYFLGCFNGAVVVSRFILLDDVRTHGSGNAGLTNFHRVYGGPLTLLVICADVLKAVLAVSFAMYIAGSISLSLIPVAKYWAGMFCLLGHMFPVTFGFKGGKGILSGGIIAIMIDWRVALVVWGGFLLLAVLTRYVSLGSCWAGLSFPFVSWFVYQDLLILAMSTVIGVLILWRHRGNIVRLIKGSESKFSLHKKEKEAPPRPDDPEPPQPGPAAQAQEPPAAEEPPAPVQEQPAPAPKAQPSRPHGQGSGKNRKRKRK